MLRIHQEMLDIINEAKSGFWGTQWPGINPEQLSDWFNTIKEFWPWNDGPV